MMLIVILVLVVVAVIAAVAYAHEGFTQFFYPFNTNDIEYQYLKGTPIVLPRCTDACVNYDRYRGQLVDNECEKMCTNDWTHKGKQAYQASLQKSIESGIRNFAL
jgi:hypothetical protein